MNQAMLDSRHRHQLEEPGIIQSSNTGNSRSDLITVTDLMDGEAGIRSSLDLCGVGSNMTTADDGVRFTMKLIQRVCV